MKTAGVTRCMFIGCSQMSKEWVCACIRVFGLLNLFRPQMGFPLKFRASLTVKLWEPASED